MSDLTRGSVGYPKRQEIEMSIKGAKDESLDSTDLLAKEWKEEIDKLNAETDKRIKKYLEESKWRKKA